MNKLQILDRIWQALVVISVVAWVVILLLGNSAQASNGTGPRWVIIADSVASTVLEQGVVPTADGAWPNKVQILAPVSTTLLAGGATGYVYNPNPAKILVESVPALAPAGVILALGTNDFGTGQNISMLQANVKAMVARLKALGVKQVVCLTPIKRWDMRTRRGPNPGQVSALGHPLIPDLSAPARMTYSSAIASACGAAGGIAIYGYTAPTVVGYTHYTPPVVGTSIFLFLNTAGHAVVADWLVSAMRIRGLWQ